ncbi:hypothetical protein NHX12_030071 [Muraenolepis orangiensis]|uniref:Telomeric repeat-binding factor 2-interacting protein 1 n=1 Tax=Muraenolepis orangiensis TaxID=630683 RepID=A0A9Q0ED76_9TELE|nr:hypothetical protein NHX12_030071 [Muraenolepis orangiensis]
MPSKLESQGKSHVISPVLFMTVDGEPMRFYLCPGPVKVELQPHIKAGGGMVCKAQEPGAILLVDPDVGSLMESTAHWYVSAQYVRDCIEKSEQLQLEDYRMRSDATDAQSTKKKTPKTSSTDILTGRSPYTPKEDTAIVGYVSSRNGHKGTLLWREMEKKLVTAHSWQSMKHRYISKLMARPSGAPEDGGGNAGSSEMAENQGAHGDGSSPEKHRASLSEDLTSSDLAQVLLLY